MVWVFLPVSAIDVLDLLQVTTTAGWTMISYEVEDEAEFGTRLRHIVVSASVSSLNLFVFESASGSTRMKGSACQILKH